MERDKLMKYTLTFCYDCGRRRHEVVCAICNKGMCLDCVDWVDEVGGMVCKECHLDMLLKGVEYVSGTRLVRQSSGGI